MSFIVTSGSPIEVGTSGHRSGAIGTVLLASSIIARAAAMSRRGEIRWGVILKLVDLDLCNYDVCSDLLDL